MKNTALVVIDLINDIVHPDGKISSPSLFISENHVIEKNNVGVNYIESLTEHFHAHIIR